MPANRNLYNGLYCTPLCVLFLILFNSFQSTQLYECLLLSSLHYDVFFMTYYCCVIFLFRILIFFSKSKINFINLKSICVWSFRLAYFLIQKSYRSFYPCCVAMRHDWLTDIFTKIAFSSVNIANIKEYSKQKWILLNWRNICAFTFCCTEKQNKGGGALRGQNP